MMQSTEQGQNSIYATSSVHKSYSFPYALLQFFMSWPHSRQAAEMHLKISVLKKEKNFYGRHMKLHSYCYIWQQIDNVLR